MATETHIHTLHSGLIAGIKAGYMLWTGFRSAQCCAANSIASFWGRQIKRLGWLIIYRSAEKISTEYFFPYVLRSPRDKRDHRSHAGSIQLPIPFPRPPTRLFLSLGMIDFAGKRLTWSNINGRNLKYLAYHTVIYTRGRRIRPFGTLSWCRRTRSIELFRYWQVPKYRMIVSSDSER